MSTESYTVRYLAADTYHSDGKPKKWWKRLLNEIWGAESHRKYIEMMVLHSIDRIDVYGRRVWFKTEDDYLMFLLKFA